MTVYDYHDYYRRKFKLKSVLYNIYNIPTPLLKSYNTNEKLWSSDAMEYKRCNNPERASQNEHLSHCSSPIGLQFLCRQQNCNCRSRPISHPAGTCEFKPFLVHHPASRVVLEIDFIDLNNRRLLKRKLEGEVVLYFKIS